MSFFWVHRDLTISTPIPAGVKTADVVALLQQREQHLRRSPVVLQVEKLEGQEPETFLVTEQISYLPRNTFTATFTDRPDGTDAAGKIGGSTDYAIRFRVAEGAAGTAGGAQLREEVAFDGWLGLVDFIVPVFRSVHARLHAKILEDAQRMAGQ